MKCIIEMLSNTENRILALQIKNRCSKVQEMLSGLYVDLTDKDSKKKSTLHRGTIICS